MNRKIFRDVNGRHTAYQDADERLKYEIDWSPELKADTIASVAYPKVSGVTISDTSNADRTTSFWVSGTDGYVTSRITTAAGARIDQTIYIKRYTA